MRYQPDLERLRMNSARCRELAGQATDPETAQALGDIADEIEAAIAILEESPRTGTSG